MSSLNIVDESAKIYGVVMCVGVRTCVCVCYCGWNVNTSFTNVSPNIFLG
jgi:hypothetical protein